MENNDLMKKPRAQWDKDEIMFKIVATEYFYDASEEYKDSDNQDAHQLAEKKFEIITPIRSVAEAMFKDAIDYCKFHNMKSDNRFVVKLYGGARRLLKAVVVRGQLDEGEYQKQLHEDFAFSKSDRYKMEPEKPKRRKYNCISDKEKIEIIREYYHGNNMANIAIKHNTSVNIISKVVAEVKLTRYDIFEKQAEENK